MELRTGLVETAEAAATAFGRDEHPIREAIVAMVGVWTRTGPAPRDIIALLLEVLAALATAEACNGAAAHDL